MVECARNMIKGKNISNGFWAEEISIAVYLKNISPNKCLDIKTPFEALYGFKLAVHHLRVFGSKYFGQIPKEDRNKFNAKAIKCIFVGYRYDFKAYKMFNPSTHKVFVGKDDIFHEHVDEGNTNKSYEEWHIPLLIDENNDEAKDNNLQ